MSRICEENRQKAYEEEDSLGPLLREGNNSNLKKSRSSLLRISSRWTQTEDEKLSNLVEKYGTKNWKKITDYLETRTPIQCFYRWNKVLKLKQLDRPFSPEEDQCILNFVNKYGFSKWTECTKILKYRTSKQIKERWFKCLANEESLMNIWTPQDELKLLNVVCVYGTCWSKIKKIFKFKNENSLKNKFYSILRRVANQKLNGNEFVDEKVNVVQLKFNDLVKFIPDAIEEIKKAGNIENLENFDTSLLETIDIKDTQKDKNPSHVLKDNLLEQLNIERLKENLLAKTYNECKLDHQVTDEKTMKKMYFCGNCKENLKIKIKERIINIYNKKKVEKIRSMIEEIKETYKEATFEKVMQLKNLMVMLKKDLV
jgi:hypothetical protein